MVTLVTARILGPDDGEALEAFLVLHRDTSMFLRTNSRRGGLVDHGEMFQATYAGAFHGNSLVAVAAHSWSGNVLVQAPEALDEVVKLCVQASGRRVRGMNGPLAQVRVARRVLGLEDAKAETDSDEGLYTLDLKDVVLPPVLTSGAVATRQARDNEHALLREWRLAYDIELLGARDTPEQRESSWNHVKAQLDRDDVRLATVNDVPVSLSAFNASLPDIVQLGGIYTPPELRGRGYAKASVAASLLSARERGASRAVLFTDGESAIKTYEALGFRLTGEYALIILE
jgi:predicted GNAT family acetyltransferase